MNSEKIKNILSEMTLEEKVSLCGCGADLLTRPLTRLGVGAVRLPRSLILPRADVAALGCSYSLELAAEYGKILSAEAVVSGAAIGGIVPLGVIREPMSVGSEAFLGEDAYYVGEMAKAIIDASGVKLIGGGILGGEYRFAERWMDARAATELYLRPFLKVAKSLGGVAIPAGALNGEMCSASKWLVGKVTDNLNRSAFVFNEFGSIVSKGAAVAAGACYQVGDNANDGAELYKSINGGYMFERLLDDCLARLLWLTINADNGRNMREVQEIDGNFERKLCEQSIVLLKNDNVLPIAAGGRVSVFGDIAKSECAALGGELQTIYNKTGGKLAVVFLKLEGEYYTAPQLAAVNKAIDSFESVVVVLLASRPAPLPFVHDAAAIFYVPTLSSHVFSVLAEMLVGKLNPCGKLNFSYAYQSSDYPAKAYAMAEGRGMFCYESVLSGYKYFNAFSRAVMFELGHGLSYTGFEISKLKCTPVGDEVDVSFVVKNVGMMPGRSTVFVFGCLPYENIYGLKSRLMAFKGINLEKGENIAVHLTIPASELSVFDAANNEWLLPGGKLEIFAGLSAADRRVNATVKIPHSTRYNLGFGCKNVASYYTEGAFNPLGADVEKVMGVPLLVKDEPIGKVCAKPSGAETGKSVKQAVKKLLKNSSLSASEAAAVIGEFSKYAIDKLNHYM